MPGGLPRIERIRPRTAVRAPSEYAPATCADAGPDGPDHAGFMSGSRPVIVYPPDEDGGRRVRVDGEILGRAFAVRDVVEFLRRAGLQDWDQIDVARSELIEWRGGGPDVWEH